MARPPSRLYEFQKTVRRHKVGFVAAAALMLALAIGLGFSLWQGTLATRAGDELRAQILATETARREAEKSAYAEAQQRTRAETLLRESQTAEAELTFAKGLEIAERGDADYGMMWMIEALKRAPAGQTNFEDMVRRNLSGWSPLLLRLLQNWESQTHAFSAEVDGTSPPGTPPRVSNARPWETARRP